MQAHSSLFVFLAFFSAVNLFSDSVAIIYDAPGQYLYAGGMAGAPTDLNDSMFIITTSNIVIDLGGNIFRQDPANTIPGFKCFTIAPNISNVTIRNGTIAGFTGTAITVSDGCFDIFFDNITIAACVDAGIYLAGQTGIMDIAIKNTNIANIMPGTASVTAGIHGVNIARMRISNCYFEGNEFVPVLQAAGIHLENSSVFEFTNNRAVGQQGVQFASGFMFENCTEGIIKDCLSYANNTSGVSLSDKASGFYMVGCQRMWMNASQSVAGNSNGGQCFGFYSQEGSRNIFENVLAQSEQAASDAAGILLSREVGSYVNESTIRGITSLNANAYGIQLTSTCAVCHLHHNIVSNNNGSLATFGIVDFANPSTSLIAKNECFNNETNYSVTYPGFSLPVINASLSNASPGLPALVCGTFDNVSVNL